MPRSFLVKTHPSPRAPDYARLETRRETNGPCTACRVLGVPLLLPEKVAPAQPWDRLPQTEAAQGASGPDLPEADRTAPRAGQAPRAPLKDSLHHLALRPLLVLPTRWPPILDPDRDRAPERLLGAQQDLRPSGGFQCPRCRRPYLTLTGLARHRQLHCPLQAQRCFTCRFCDKEYASLGALKMHIRTHTLPCACATCGKAFSRPWLLQGHIRTHTAF
ncbi:zinc finger protein SNAI3 [Talpa occidentalis]|uniref:zinc finger protein SNAI3 n=1 Tax=Talpa occidentalis TaxID=50954 RepID=UPI0023F62BB0|nr:zinc finger protein SNAI3 [Talpa occidentalis]